MQPIPQGQQPFQGVSNMTHGQVQQVQQVLQSYPPEKLATIQQQVQQVMPPPSQMLNQPQVLSPQPMFPGPQQQPVSKPAYTTTAPSGLFGSKHSSGSHSTQSPSPTYATATPCSSPRLHSSAVHWSTAQQIA
jgi:hypothetical protein